MKYVLAVLILFAQLVSCRKTEPVCSDCIQSKVEEFKASVHFEAASVKEYRFQ